MKFQISYVTNDSFDPKESVVEAKDSVLAEIIHRHNNPGARVLAVRTIIESSESSIKLQPGHSQLNG